MKKILAIVISLTMFVLSGCSVINSDKKSIVCSIYPYYDFVRAIIGANNETFSLDLILSPGQDCHTYDPAASDIIAIKKADLFIYTDAELESWATSIVETLSADVVVLHTASFDGIELKVAITEEHEHEDEEHEDEEEHHHTFDPHIWTLLPYVYVMISEITKQIIAMDPENTIFYQANADNYVAKLKELEAELNQIMAERVRDKLYFVAPFAFFYLFDQYGLSWETLYGTCSLEIDPSITDIVDMIEDINTENVKYIYTRELLNINIDARITEYTGATTLLLHSAHNVGKADFDNGVTYYDIMKQNIINLRKGLCE